MKIVVDVGSPNIPNPRSLTRIEIDILERCLDAYQANGLVGLLDHVQKQSNRLMWFTTSRDQVDLSLVFLAVKQSIMIDLIDNMAVAADARVVRSSFSGS
jgi:hypothetical protein